MAKKIFNSSMHSYQVQSIAIIQDLRKFFYKNPENSIDFGSVLVKPNGNIMQLLTKKQNSSFQTSFPMYIVMGFQYKRRKQCNHSQVADNLPSIWPQGKSLPQFTQWQLPSYQTLLYEKWSLAQVNRPLKLTVHKSNKSYHKSCTYRWISTKVFN